MVPTRIDGESKDHRFLFAHGAGAPMDTPFMTRIARGLAERGIQVVRFEFPYMAARRETPPRRRPPDREPALVATWNEVIETFRDVRRLVIGGKSMGGRFATKVADEARVDGIVCFGYPFHPPGKPSSLRTSHLETLRTPALFVQGTRDALGSRADVETYALSKAIRFAWIEDGDHSLKPRAASGRTEKEALEEAITAAAAFIVGP